MDDFTLEQVAEIFDNLNDVMSQHHRECGECADWKLMWEASQSLRVILLDHDFWKKIPTDPMTLLKQRIEDELA